MLNHYKVNSGEFDGIGFVLSDADPYLGFDLDDCIGPEGQLSSQVQSIIDRLDSYSEISPSGNGIRIIMEGKLPEGVKNRRSDIDGAKAVEIYDRARYLTMTGQALYGKPKPIQAIEPSFWSHYNSLGISVMRGANVAPNPIGLQRKDQWVIEKLSADDKYGAEFKRLFNYGELSSFEGDQSRADLKLIGLISHYAGFDEAQISRIFRAGKLYQDKSDKPHRDDSAT